MAYERQMWSVSTAWASAGPEWDGSGTSRTGGINVISDMEYMMQRSEKQSIF